MSEGQSRRRGPILALLSAVTISTVGSAVTLIAIPWYVLGTTGSPAAAGGVGAVTVLSEVLGGFLGGSLVDRLGPRRVTLAARLASGAATAAIPALHASVGIAYWQLLVLAGARALCDAPSSAAVQAMIPAMAEAGKVRLEQANAAISAIFRGSFILAGPTAGILIGLIGPANLLWIDAASFWCSAAVVAVGVPGALAHPAWRPAGAGADLLGGLRCLVADRLLLGIVVTVALTNFLDSPLSGVLLPVYARRTYGSALALGLLVTANAIGGLLGSSLYGLTARYLPRRATYLGAWLGAAIGFWALALAPSLALAAGALCAMGIAAGPINPIIATVLQERVPAELQGRVFGAARAVAFAASPLGVLTGGLTLEVLSVRQVLLGISAAYILVVVAMWLLPAFRRLEPAPASA